MLCRAFLQRGDSSRSAPLRAAVVCGAILVAITEGLSVPRLLTRGGLIVAWSAALVCAGTFLIATMRKIPAPPGPASRATVHLPPRFMPLDLFLGAAIAGLVAVIGSIAIMVPPNSWDVMQQHMPRVIFWVSNRTLRPFATPDLAQLVLGTGSETIALNTYLLWGGDRLANMGEFLSLCGSAVAASLIAQQFGARRTGQLLAALFVVTIPEALLESSGAMTTGVVAFWTVSACYFMLRAGEEKDTWDIVTAGLACGLALLTKGLTFVYLPFLLAGCLAFRPRAVRVWMLKRVPVLIALVLAMNAGQFVRAYQVTGTPFNEPFAAGGPRLAFVNARCTPTAIAANVLRQTTLQMGTPSSKLNARLEAATRKAISLLGQDADDPGASWSGFAFYIDHPTRLETQAGNTVHFAIVVLCFGALGIAGLGLEDKRGMWFCVGIVCAFIAFCGCVRWQPWGSRFHLPLFVAAAAIVGAVVERVLRRRWLILIFAAVLLVVALPYALSNATRSILKTKNFSTVFEPRAELYFADQHMWQAKAQLALASAVRARGCGSVALDAYLPVPEAEIKLSPPSFYVYPLLAQLGVDGQSRFVHYIHVQNATARFAASGVEAKDCAVVCLSCRLSRGKKSDAGMGETLIFGDDELVLPRGGR